MAEAGERLTPSHRESVIDATFLSPILRSRMGASPPCEPSVRRRPRDGQPNSRNAAFPRNGACPRNLTAAGLEYISGRADCSGYFTVSLDLPVRASSA